VSKCYTNARKAIQELAADVPSPTSIAFMNHGVQCDHDAVSNLCALPDFFIEEPLPLSSSDAAGVSPITDPLANDKADVGAKRVRSTAAADNAGSKTRGKK
jgi:hypothetical protein